MRHVWWDFMFNPETREVCVRRWVKLANTWARIECEFPGLTWAEALDVFDADSTAELLGLNKL